MPLKDLLSDPTSQARVLAGAQPFYVSGEDHLQVRAFNTATVTLAIVGRMLLPDGRVMPFVESFTPSTGGALATKLIVLPEGWLLNVAVQVTSGTPTSTQTLALLRIVRGFDTSLQSLGTLAQGFVTASQEVSWPITFTGAAASASAASAPTVQTIVGTNPAAGIEIAETVPASTVWELLAIKAQLVTDATVANRLAILTIDDGTNVQWQGETNGNQTASNNPTYTGGAGLPTMTPLTNGRTWQLMNKCILAAGYRVRTVTTNLQAGDNWTAPVLLVQVWSV